MRHARINSLVLWISALCWPLSADEPARPSISSEKLLGFRLPAPDGSVVELAPESSAKLTVIGFLGTECPLARLYGPRLEDLQQRFGPRGVRFIGVNSNVQDAPDEVREYVREHRITFPVVKDPAQKVADQFGAKRTPEVFVVDRALRVVYRGRVDDQYQPGVSRNKPGRDDLREALEDHLAGRAIRVARTEASGCLIGRSRPAVTSDTITFNNQVSRVLNLHCVECHRRGEIGPFGLTHYDEVTGWGETLLESIDAGRMPPWHANPEYGRFANARFMPDSDKQILRDWVAAGMPLGDPSQSPALPAETSDWQLPRPPDLVVPMRDRPYAVPATGTVEYQYFVVDPGFTEDRWVSAAQVVPGNRSVVHHCIVFIRPPDGTVTRGVGWLTGYVPGQRTSPGKPGRARRVPAGSKLVFQMHYTPNGTPQTDLTQIGLTFLPAEEVTHEVFSVIAIDQEFEIPPQAADYPVRAAVRRLPERGELLAIVPHMHVRGKSFQVRGRSDGQERILLDVPRYDFNWQHVYELAEPLDLATLSALEITARFDNSPGNPANPDPTQYVTWGDQTWEEMAIAFFEVGVPVERGPDGKLLVSRQRARGGESAEPVDRAAEVEAFVKQFLERFDGNRDGVIERTETPLVFRNYGFQQVDRDGDGRLTRNEVEASARRKFR